MTRKEFLKIAAMGAAGTALTFARGGDPVWAQAAPGLDGHSSSISPDLVAIKGGTQSSRLDRALRELGGIGAFVKKGQTVVIKPNIGWDQEPRTGANTNPELVRRLVEQCFDAGAKRVLVFDHTCDTESACFRTTLIGPYAREAGATIVPAGQSSYYHEITVPGAVLLKRTQLHEAILEADVFFNVPVLKEHSGVLMSCAIKNLMGMIWDRRIFHSQGLEQCMADSCLIRKPTLTLIDADRVMLNGGPRAHAGSQYSDQHMLMVSQDMVALEATGAMTLGKRISDFKLIEFAEAHGIGTSDLRRLNIRRLSI